MNANAPTVRPPKPSEGCAILLVDDNKLDIELLKKALPEYDVTAATSAEEALEVLSKRNDFHVIVADHNLQRMNGTELLAACARSWPEVQRILMSGVVDRAMLINAVNTGALAAFLDKNLRPSEVRLRVQQACDRWREFNGSQAGVIHELRAAAASRAEQATALQTLTDKTDERLTSIEGAVVQIGHTVETLATGVLEARQLALAAEKKVDKVDRKLEEVDDRIDDELSTPGVDVKEVIQEVQRQQRVLSQHDIAIGDLAQADGAHIREDAKLKAELAAAQTVIAAIQGERKPAPGDDGTSIPPPPATLATNEEKLEIMVAKQEATLVRSDTHAKRIRKGATWGIVLSTLIIVSERLIEFILKQQ